MGTERTEMRWIDDDHLDFSDVSLQLFFASDSEPCQTSPPRFRIEKTRSMIEFYEQRFGGSRTTNMFEIGIQHGGSVVLFHKMLRPSTLVAIDIVPEHVRNLDAYLDGCGARSAVRAFFGVDQADAAAVRRIICNEFGREPIDLVIDDGCHWLDETRKSFNTIFPYVRSGGAYVIEDWGWAHWSGIWQVDGGMWRQRPSLTQLILELAMLSASRPDLVESVHVRHDLVLVTKGTAGVPPDFDVSTSYLTQGRRYLERRSRLIRLSQSRARLRRAVETLRRDGAASFARQVAGKVSRAFGRRREP